MDNISEAIRKQLQSKKAWITAVSLIPVTLLAIWVFVIWLEDGLLFEIPFWGAVTAFFAGVCLDQAAHIYCCYKGSKTGLIMRICASVLELIGVMWFTIWLSVEFFELMLLFFVFTLFLLMICLWKAFEVWSLINCKRLIYGQTARILSFFGSVGIILGLLFLLITLFLWLQYIGYCGNSIWPWDIPEIIGHGLVISGFSFIPVYMISLSLHSFSLRDAFRAEFSE